MKANPSPKLQSQSIWDCHDRLAVQVCMKGFVNLRLYYQSFGPCTGECWTLFLEVLSWSLWLAGVVQNRGSEKDSKSEASLPKTDLKKTGLKQLDPDTLLCPCKLGWERGHSNLSFWHSFPSHVPLSPVILGVIGGREWNQPSIKVGIV